MEQATAPANETDAIYRKDLLGHGFIELIGHMGGDVEIVNNARVSFNRSMTQLDFASEDGPKEATGLINFLIRNRHGSPIEAPVFRFRVKAPIFVMREWHRHRISSLNEESMRYSIKDTAEFYVPAAEQVRTQVGKPGSYTFEPIEDQHLVNESLSKIELSQHFAFRTYRELVDMGVAKELARVVIPVGFFSTMIWQANLRSIMNFLSLRNAPDAQWEIGQYAAAMEDMVSQVVPIAMNAFQEYGRQPV